jgi:RNA recognition motif-containing protein
MKKKPKIFVGNLSWKTTEDQLKMHFETYGSVSGANIVTDPLTGKSRGFGFVEMEDDDAANTAIRELNDKPLLNRNLRVSKAQERSDQPPRREGGREGGRDSGREGGREGGRGGHGGGYGHESAGHRSKYGG